MRVIITGSISGATIDLKGRKEGMKSRGEGEGRGETRGDNKEES